MAVSCGDVVSVRYVCVRVMATKEYCMDLYSWMTYGLWLQREGCTQLADQRAVGTVEGACPCSHGN